MLIIDKEVGILKDLKGFSFKETHNFCKLINSH